MWRRLTALLLMACCAVLASPALAQAQGNPARPPLRSGSAFLSPELRAMQADEFANPGMLWVEEGARLWSEPAGKTGKGCASCHGDASASMKDAAARYPA